jgi:hypothetical protein
MPGSWVSRPATNSGMTWAFSHAERYVGTENAAACALQNPNEANCTSAVHSDSATSGGIPRSFEPARIQSRSSPTSSGSPRRRRTRSAVARSQPVTAATQRMTCSW